MKFTNAFPTALLFCGVTPVAIEKKRDEHAPTIIRSPFATPLSIALVTPSEAAFGGITNGTHDLLEARKPNTEPKPNTKPATEPKIQPKPKTEPKGKADVPCTAKQRKAGQCPDQKRTVRSSIPQRAVGLAKRQVKRPIRRVARRLSEALATVTIFPSALLLLSRRPRPKLASWIGPRMCGRRLLGFCICHRTVSSPRPCSWNGAR
jgi:hypothetical protein